LVVSCPCTISTSMKTVGSAPYPLPGWCQYTLKSQGVIPRATLLALNMPKLRQNIITGDWVVISPERAKRPEDFITAATPKRQSKADCPFCIYGKKSAYKKFNLKEAETENVYVIPNKFPAFVLEDEILEEGGDFYPSYKSLGEHEVIVLKNHDIELRDLSAKVFLELLTVYQNRIIVHNKNPIVEYAFVIHNYGPEAAASIEHPHSQIFSPSIIPSYIEKELKGALGFYKENKKCVFCHLIEEEKKQNVRIVEENDDFIAFCFFAARFPFEIWLLPKRHSARFETISKKEKLSLVKIMKTIFSTLNHALNDPSFNFYIHNAPAIEILPRVSKFGGYELGSGMVIDVVSPEHAAEFLRSTKRKQS